MSPASFALLSEFWSWVNAIFSVLLLGLLLPASLGLCIGMTPVARQRRDGRAFLPMFLVIGLSTAAGVWTLLNVHQGPPASDFWLVLDLQIGFLALVFSSVGFLRLGLRRAKEEREDVNALRVSTADRTSAPTFEGPGVRERLSGIDAEYYVAQWMRAAGASEATVTRARRDGGVDVRSVHYVAQVKHRPNDFVSVDLVRALHGVASEEGRTPLFFASSHYSRDATEFARRVGMGLFIFQPSRGRFIAANSVAQRLIVDGLRAGSVDGTGRLAKV